MKTGSDKEGITLIELLMGLAVFTILVNTGALLYAGASRLSDAGEASLDVARDLGFVRGEFLKFARDAKNLANAAGPHTRGESLVIFELPAAASEEQRFALLGHIDAHQSPKSIILSVIDGLFQTVYFKSFPNSVETLAFSYPETEDRMAPLVRMTVSVDNLGMENTIPRRNTFYAAARANEARSQ